MSASPSVPEGSEHLSGMHRRILRAAEECFVDFGRERTTMVDVARVAGVSRPTVYRYFRDRDALVAEVVSRRIRAALAQAARTFDASTTLVRALHRTLTLLVDRGRNDPVIRTLVIENDEASPGLRIWQVALGVSAEFWAPVLADARERGELRPGLSTDEVCAWLAEVLLFLVGRAERAGALDTAEWIGKFVVPALVVGS